MLKVSRSLPDIAVLRGGTEDFGLSMEEGQEVLKSLSRLGYKPLDVVIDKHGAWTTQGVPTDAHMIFTRAHTIVDTTRDSKSAYAELAKKMGVSLLFSREDRVCMDREDMYRLLRMQGFKVPDTIVVRASQPLEGNLFREVWSKYHTPLMVRPLRRTSDVASKLITMYPDFEHTVREYHTKGIDVHILTYRRVPTSSVAVLPNFRGEKLYTPLWVETFESTNAIPSESSKMRIHFHAPEYRKRQIKEVAHKVYEALELSGPATIDMVPYKDGYVVVNIETNPSLRKGGRFMQSLSSTGVDIGHYVHEQIKNDVASDAVYGNQVSEYDLAR